MIRHLGYTRERFEQVSERMRERIYAESRPADDVLVSAAVDRISWEEAQALDYRPAVLGERFGPLWATYWFRVRATVPEEWRGRRVDLLFVSQCEAALWRDGRILQGLNTGGDGKRPTPCWRGVQSPGRSSCRSSSPATGCSAPEGRRPS